MTRGDLADQGMDVWAWCNGCFKNGAVATDTLIARGSVFARGHQQDGEGPASWRGRIPVPLNFCRGRTMLNNVDVVGQTAAVCDQLSFPFN